MRRRGQLVATLSKPQYEHAQRADRPQEGGHHMTYASLRSATTILAALTLGLSACGPAAGPAATSAPAAPAATTAPAAAAKPTTAPAPAATTAPAAAATPAPPPPPPPPPPPGPPPRGQDCPSGGRQADARASRGRASRDPARRRRVARA